MKPWWIVIVLASAWGNSSRADEASELAAKAIKVQYGEAADAAKGAKVQSTSVGKVQSAGGEREAVREIAAHWPKQCRVGFLLTIGGEKKGVELGIDGDSGWIRGTGQSAEDIEGQKREEVAGDIYVYALASLIPLQKDGVKLAIAADSKVNGKPAKALKVSATGRPDVTLYFDAESFQLVRANYQGTEAGNKVAKDFIYDDHREVQGVLVPHKLTEYIDRKKIAEWKVKDIKFVDTLPKGIFEKP